MLRRFKITRINVVPVEELHYTHLVAEYRELPRVFTLARNAQRDILGGRKKLPVEWTLGTGHVTFYFNKIGYCKNRYKQLVQEMQKRGYKPNAIPLEELTVGIDKKLLGDYIPTKEALVDNRQRISLRLKEAAKRKGK